MPSKTDARALILVVDDNQDLLDVYGMYLTMNGFRVRTARDGLDGVRQAGADAPVLILMDLQMPGLDGTAAMHTMRRIPQLRAVPIVAVTAHVLESQREATLREGFDAVLSKPCMPGEIVRTVRRLLATGVRH